MDDLSKNVNNVNYIRDCESLCLSDETLKAVGPFYLVSMPGEKDNSLKTTSVLAQRWAVCSILTKN